MERSCGPTSLVDKTAQVFKGITDKPFTMAIANHLIMDLLRIITPEEVGEITTKHNGGKFLSLTELVNERVQNNIYRNFSQPIDIDNHSGEAKILPFKADNLKADTPTHSSELSLDEESLKKSLSTLAENMQKQREDKEQQKHNEDENMSSFILIEKARLKRSQQALKQKEILELYQKNLNVDVEQIKGQESNMDQAKESGILINKKHY